MVGTGTRMAALWMVTPCGSLIEFGIPLMTLLMMILDENISILFVSINFIVHVLVLDQTAKVYAKN